MTPKIKTFLRIFKIADSRHQMQNVIMETLIHKDLMAKLAGLNILTERDFAFYNQNCEGVKRPPQVVVEPKTELDLQEVVKSCITFKQPYHVFSGGNNWGYGTALSVQSTDLLISLKALQQLSNYDEELGVLTVQAGVTQEQLYSYLQEKKSKWMVPTTGAGPLGTIIGNGLERGFGLNQNTDHFLGLQSFRTLLPNGEFLENNLSSNFAYESARVSRWGTGPYLEGLFSQSNLGIVTQAQVNLAPRPKEIYLLVIKASQQQLPILVQVLQDIRTMYPGFIGGINLSDKARLSSTMKTSADPSLQPHSIFEKALGLELNDYQAIVPISLFAGNQKSIAKHIYRIASKRLSCKLLKESSLRSVDELLQKIDWSFIKNLKSKIRDATQLCNLLKGEPTDFALKTAYIVEPKHQKLNPAIDQVGILWFAPILPLNASTIIELQNICKKTLPKYAQKVATTISNFDSRLCEATIPILFDRHSLVETARASECWLELYEECLKLGLSPYRFSILHMEKAISKSKTYQHLLYDIKRVVDPDDLFSRNRYAPATRLVSDEKLDSKILF